MNIGSRIKEVRKHKGLSQAEAAKAAGIAINSLRLYEAGSRQPNIEQLENIAHALGVQLTDLISITEVSIPWDISLDQKLSAVGCSVGFNEEDAYLWINYTDGTLEVTEADLQEINSAADSFLRFKLDELKNRNQGKFKARK